MSERDGHGVRRLRVEELARWRREGRRHWLVDVRPRSERALASIEGAVGLDELPGGLDALDRDATLVFLCHHGIRSMLAARRAIDAGFTDVHNLEGGIDAWARDVDPDIPRY
ncbi:MAG: rhodanese-like domain-containing protein [Myxococcota bacterium]|nr:rhodanese-like domain-containing protein [Myxococcota bacterium]MDW8362412.1 rhodanese-like domain-containing protein [Myxococcales bacterium]